jgi:hypothetical protein
MRPVRNGSDPLANDLDNLVVAANRFTAASAELRDARDLLRRVDTKFLCDHEDAAAVLAAIAGDYAALTVPSGNVATYRSLYFDTGDLRCFHDHRRGRRLRHKIRIRHYPDRLLSYLEVKTKRNEEITDKRRIPIPFREEWLGSGEQQFLTGAVGHALAVDDLRPVMRIDFRRLSLVGLRTAERVTVDLAMVAEGLDGSRWSFGDVVIIEVKQSPFCVRTPVMRALTHARLREGSMSKYTISTALLRPELRANRLLPEVRRIERMSA